MANKLTFIVFRHVIVADIEIILSRFAGMNFLGHNIPWYGVVTENQRLL